MGMPPAYWTLIGEITLVLIGTLVAVIVFVLRDRKNLKEYSLYLKELVKKLKKKIKEHEDEQSQERVQELIRAMIDHVRAEYQLQAGGEINESLEEGLGFKPSIEQFILITGFQMLSAELTALDNSNEPEAAWEMIKNKLMPLIQNFLQPALAAQAVSRDSSKAETSEGLQQRIENLEQFKQLYFNLQKNMAEQITEIEQLNQKIAELADGSENSAAIMAVIEKNKTHYISMGQLLGMDKEQHHQSVADSMDYSDVLISEGKDEIKRLKSNNAHQLKDAELCIETMDMEIQTLTAEVTRLEKQLEQQGGAEPEVSTGLSHKERDEMIARFTQESKELMSCITGLEDNAQEQSEKIKQLEAENAQLKAKLTE